MSFKLVSLNLWLGGKLLPNILDFLRQEKPDILILQEAYSGTDLALAERFRSLPLIQEALSLPFIFFSPAGFFPGAGVEFGNAILSRFPFQETETIFFDQPFASVPHHEDLSADHTLSPRNLQRVSVLIDNQSYQIFNTQGIWTCNDEDSERRLLMSQTIVEQVRGRERVILGGDLNVVPGTKTIANIEAQLVNVFYGRLSSTFNLRQKQNPKFADFAVDFVFASPDISVLNSTCPDVDVSDHLPLICEFEA